MSTEIEGSGLFYNTSARHQRHKYNTNNTSSTCMRQEQRDCETSETRALHERHKCDSSAARTTRVQYKWKKLILIMTREKTYLFLPIWQIKIYQERNNLILRTTFGKCLVPMPKWIWAEKTELCNKKSYIKVRSDGTVFEFLLTSAGIWI